jgi:hypothetical protein
MTERFADRITVYPAHPSEMSIDRNITTARTTSAAESYWMNS